MVARTDNNIYIHLYAVIFMLYCVRWPQAGRQAGRQAGTTYQPTYLPAYFY